MSEKNGEKKVSKEVGKRLGRVHEVVDRRDFWVTLSSLHRRKDKKNNKKIIEKGVNKQHKRVNKQQKSGEAVRRLHVNNVIGRCNLECHFLCHFFFLPEKKIKQKK